MREHYGNVSLAHYYYEREKVMTRCRSVRTCGSKFECGGLLLYLICFIVRETAPSIGEMSKIELLKSRLKSDIPLHDIDALNDAAVVARNVCTIVDQIKHLRSAIENTIELSKSKRDKSNGSYEGE